MVLVLKLNFFMPKYMANFKCIGPNCTDTCCAGWDINIDEYTFNKYENSKDKLKLLVKDKYIQNKKSNDSFNYGFMVIENTNKCPFLNDSMLCDIHGNCGEENLSITCRRYPRVFNIIDNIYEKSGIPSCEEVCKKAFLNKDKMEFIETSEIIDENSIEIRRMIDSEAFIGSDSLLQYFWDIRVISINIMQNRNFNIEERLSILKNFYSNLEKLRDNNDFYNIEIFLENLNDENFNFNSLKESNFTENTDFYNLILSDNLFNNVIGVKIKSFLQKLRKDILKIEKDFKNINLNKINLDNYNYIFENYLVNQIFKDIIPFNKGMNLGASIKVVINTYRIIKAYILCSCTYSKELLTEHHIIKIIQALSKDTEHNKVFKEILENS